MQRLIPLFAVLFAIPLHAQSRGAVERFNVPENADSWSVYDFAAADFFFPEFFVGTDDPDLNSIYWLFDGDNGFSFSSLGASGGAFAGDLAAQRASGVSFWIEVEDASVVDYVEVSFYSVTMGRYYYSETVGPENGWQEVTFNFSDRWFIWDGTQYVETPITGNILSDVDEFVVGCVPVSTAADGTYVGLDDFTVVPELIVPTLDPVLAGGRIQFSFEEWDAQTYVAQSATTGFGAADWSNQPGALFRSGGNLVLNQPTTGSKRFWRVDTELEFTDVPDLIP